MAQQLLTDIDGMTDLITFVSGFIDSDTGGGEFGKFIDLLLKIFPDCEFVPTPPGQAADSSLKGKKVNYRERMAFDVSVQRSAVRAVQEIQLAMDAVRPHVGDLPMKDNANAVYKAALERLGVDTRGVADVAMKDIWKHARHRRQRAVAMDRKAEDECLEMFPNMNRLA